VYVRDNSGFIRNYYLVESTVYQRDRDGNLIPVVATSTQTRTENPAAQPQPVKTPGPKKEKRRILPKKISRPLKFFFATYLLLFIWVGVDLSGSMEKVNAFPPHQIADTDGTNWLLVGSDSRDGLSRAQQLALHTGGDFGPARSDTIMIVHIDKGGKPTLISLPRDSWIILPRHKSDDGTIRDDYMNKINASFSIGGPQLLIRTIERNTGLHIDHYMSIGLLGVRNLAVAVGGVRLCPKQNYDDRDSGLHIKKGCQIANGRTALAYVRMRHADPLGDIGRVQRQQEFVSAVLHKAMAPSLLLNPFAVRGLGKAVEGVVTVGDQDNLIDLAKFGIAMRAISKGAGRTMTVPIADSNGYRDGQSVVIWDQEKARRLFRSLGAK